MGMIYLQMSSLIVNGFLIGLGVITLIIALSSYKEFLQKFVGKSIAEIASSMLFRAAIAMLGMFFIYAGFTLLITEQ